MPPHRAPPSLSGVLDQLASQTWASWKGEFCDNDGQRCCRGRRCIWLDGRLWDMISCRWMWALRLLPRACPVPWSTLPLSSLCTGKVVTCTMLSLTSAPDLAIFEAFHGLGVMLKCCAALWSALRGWWRECVSRTVTLL